LACSSPVEIPYYSSGLFPDICFTCGGDIPEDAEDTGLYPQCFACMRNKKSEKPPKRKRNVFQDAANAKKKRT